jgi:hypothetical protein
MQKKTRLEKQAMGILMTLTSECRLRARVQALLEPHGKADKKPRGILNTMLNSFCEWEIVTIKGIWSKRETQLY